MATLRITERTSADDVLAWDLSRCESIRISKRSGFESGAQGLAVAGLASLEPGKNEVSLECEFDEPGDWPELITTPLASAFGFALARRVKRITFSGKPASSTFKAQLGQLYKQTGGVLGVGTSRAVVCADPVYPLPPSLLESNNPGGSDTYPPPSAFAAMLSRITQEMGFSQLLASTEEASLVSFIYEALRNSLEHGIPSAPAHRARSTRALIVEKIVLQGANLANRHLSPDLKQYLERVQEASSEGLGLGVACFTVADQGEGIQSTLPPKADETPQARLARAFQQGESRKPSGVVSRGLGLPAVVSAAHHLNALIRVTSRNLDMGQDFSLGEHKYPQLDFRGLRELPGSFVCGTCVSVFVPEYSVSLDQQTLFRR